MDLNGTPFAAEVQRLCETVARADAVVPVGARTHWEVGGVPAPGVEVSAPRGIVAYDPAELTVTVGAGTSVQDLTATLRAAGQECALDPRDERATVGGVLATGLSGPRRLRYGPLRERLLEVRFVSAQGRLVKGGGPTVKNVTGYDIPRLIVGSLGTLGVLVQVVLRCQPVAPAARWYVARERAEETSTRLFRPSTVAFDGQTTWALLEGEPADLVEQADRARLEPADDPPPLPDAAHRGRISVRPGEVPGLTVELDRDGVQTLGELGVGTVHVASADEDGLRRARRRAAEHGGWLLREAGAPGLDGFGTELPNLALMRRIKAAFDPSGKLAPGRLPLGDPQTLTVQSTSKTGSSS